MLARARKTPSEPRCVTCSALCARNPGCLAIGAFRSTRDPQLFYVHSRWTDEAAFDSHAELPHTVRFLERVQPLIDHPLDVTRARRV